MHYSKSKEILKYINSSEKVLLHCHPYADPDSIGSVLALKRLLRTLNKDVTAIIGDTAAPTNLSLLPINKEIENKNYFEIDNSIYDLFIILDSSSITQVSQLKEVQFPKTMKTISIDHHKTNTNFADINLVDSEASSTSQILYKIFQDIEVKIDKSMALYLFIGIFGDTGGFKLPNTTSDAFSIASALSKINPNFHKLIFELENNKLPIELEMTGVALSNIHKYLNGKVAFSEVHYKEVKKRGLTKYEAMEALVADKLRSVVGWDIVASLVEAEANITTISLRTRDQGKFDVSKIAKNIGINGGGHPGAAGTTILKDINTAKTELIDIIELMYGSKLKNN